MREQWFSSDLHLFHDNMWKLFKIPCPTCNGTGTETHPDGVSACSECWGALEIAARPFQSTQEMHSIMREAHNARVKGSDHWTTLGDVTLLRGNREAGLMMQEEILTYNGHKRLIMGNHDHLAPTYYADVFDKMRGSHKIDNLLFSHFPLHPSSIGKGCVNIHGHIHTTKSPPGPYINISMEAINYAPVPLYLLKEWAAKLLAKL